MRGLPDWNFPAFDEAETRWRNAGHTAFSPAQTDRALGYGPDHQGGIEHLKHVMLNDIAAIYHADALALLPGWEKSRGAAVELALAQFLELPIYDAVTMEEIEPKPIPWYTSPADFLDWSDVWRGCGENRLVNKNEPG